MKKVLYLLAVLLFSCACSETSEMGRKEQDSSSPVTSKPEPPKSLIVAEKGYGSSMAYNSNNATFLLLPDRGPNVDGPDKESKIFPNPLFTPHLGVFKRKDDSLILIKKIIFKDEDGNPFSGVPNISGNGETGEIAYDTQGNVIKPLHRGLDPEGVTLAADGTYWISDEYGPFMIHFDADGNYIEEFSPFNNILPAHYAKRRPNRGMEGVAISANSKIVFGAMQSPLYIPDARTKNKSNEIKILKINLGNKQVMEYTYLLEHPLNVMSDISYINDTTLLVLERSAKLNDGRPPFLQIYTSILQPNFTCNKVQFIDIRKEIPNYYHDKPEGMVLINNDFYIINDDDFGILPDASTPDKYKTKIIDGKEDVSKVYIIKNKHI